MAIRNVIEEIAAAWPTYRQKVRVDKNDPVYGSVITQVALSLQPHLAAHDTIMVHGSNCARVLTVAK